MKLPSWCAFWTAVPMVAYVHETAIADDAEHAFDASAVQILGLYLHQMHCNSLIVRFCYMNNAVDPVSPPTLLISICFK